MISFAHNHEDVLIDRVFRKSSGFFIDVGAFHPVFGSVTKYFSLEGWRGINIEPDAEAIAMLRGDRPQEVNLLCAAGRTRGPATLHRLASRSMSTTSSAHLDQLDADELSGLQRVEVEMRTLADICAEYAPHVIDFLKIDAEGAEGDVIAGADWNRFRPRLLIVEATKPWSSEPYCEEWEPVLLSHGYSLQHLDGINRYYLRHEDESLAGQLSVPVNILDCFVSFEEVQLREEVQKLREKLASSGA